MVNISKFLQIFLILIFISIAFLLTLITSFEINKINHEFVIGDWLINYQGGFVRRGLIGELILRFSKLSKINPGIITSYFHIFFYFLFFLFTFLSICQQKNLKKYILLIFSPFVFYFQIFDYLGGFRKEIIFFSVLSFLVWSLNRFKNEINDKIFIGILIFFPLLLLSHEMFIIFLPYLFAAYYLKADFNKKLFIKFFVLLILIGIVFFLSVINPGNEIVSSKIFKSLNDLEYTINGGAISWLAKDTEFGVSTVKEYYYKYNYLKKYSLATILSILAFIPLRKKFNRIFSNKFISFFVLCAIGGSILLSFVAVDWGRFLYINVVCLFLISLIRLKKGEDDTENKIYNWFFIIPLTIIYFSFWQIPACCEFVPLINEDYNVTNIHKLIKFLISFSNNYL